MRRAINKNESNSLGDNRESVVSNAVINNPYNNEQIKSFKEQAIKVLNILDSEGINIYDNNRFGGMYLKGNKKKFIPESLIKSMSEKQNNEKNNDEKENKFSQSFYDTLFKK